MALFKKITNACKWVLTRLGLSHYYIIYGFSPLAFEHRSHWLELQNKKTQEYKGLIWYKMKIRAKTHNPNIHFDQLNATQHAEIVINVQSKKAVKSRYGDLSNEYIEQIIDKMK